MGIFKLLKRTKEKNTESIMERTIVGENESTYQKDDNDQSEGDYHIENNSKTNEQSDKNYNLDRIEDRSVYLNGQCDRIKEASKQMEETKIEYQLVSSYLTDIQKIDMIPIDQREDLDEAARRIITLARDRSKYQNNTVKISDKQFRHIETYEDEMPNEIKKMKETESYNVLIKNDMRHLEGEKGSLQYQKEEVIKKQKYLKGIAVITCTLVVLLLVLILAISNAFKADMQIPFLLTILMATLSSVFIFYEARKNSYAMKLIEKKQNKAIDLLNSVKIKMVNNTSVLDYVYSKYMVHNSKELEYLWEQYVKAKDEAKRYEKNTELLDFYNESLIRELKANSISDPEIWIYQAIAIIDQKEMVEVRHRLNVRRQKLRERIDYNNSIKENSIQNIRSIMKKYPNLTPEITETLAKNGISIINE